jgi:Holliday junction resolvasome RuvABC endonuclease subunit
MSLAKLASKKGNRILGVDASTNSIAFCIIDKKKVVKYGEVVFAGGNIYDRVLDAKNKVAALRKQGFFDVDYMAIEAAIMVRSVHTGIKMAYVFGAIMGEILSNKIEVVEVHPITWQSFIGNNNFTKAQKIQVKKDYPGKSETWYKGKIREMRKDITNAFAKKHSVITSSDNVSDAFGIAWYAANEIVEA